MTPTPNQVRFRHIEAAARRAAAVLLLIEPAEMTDAEVLRRVGEAVDELASIERTAEAGR